MTIPHTPQVDGQWIDYYALLGVPVGADEDAIRKRIGKVYSEAAANSDHRNLARRQYFQALVERVLPQCRRVLLDAEWRARYDHQHTLHNIGDASAQTYVAFIASMRGDGAPLTDEALLPQRAQDEIKAARQVVETALNGADLELLPSQSVPRRAEIKTNAPMENGADDSAINEPELIAQTAPPVAPKPPIKPKAPVASEPYLEAFANAPTMAPTMAPVAAPVKAPDAIVAQVQTTPIAPTPVAPAIEPVGSAPQSSESVVKQPGEAARAQVITAQEAADIRRRRASNPDSEPFVGPGSRAGRGARSRVSVEVDDRALRRRVSPTSLNLLVAITGVLLTITIQRFAATPAVATSSGRTPVFVAVAPEMEDAIQNASLTWEKTPGGASFDVIVQSVDSQTALARALGKGGETPDAWIPANAAYAARYNQLASAAKRPPLESGASIAQTPMVLVARADRADALRRRFPDHKIGTWSALRQAVMTDGAGRFGLSDPRSSAPGAIARFSMAREWSQSHSQTPAAAAKDPQFWQWMAGFEENIPSSAAAPGAMVKDLVLGTTGRYWWAVCYESDALSWMGQGKPLELFYLPRTALADHPFCPVERVGAPLEVAVGRADFARFLQTPAIQKSLLQNGFRPTEISPSTAVAGNPFTQPAARNSGVKLQGLPRDERLNFDALGLIQRKWSEHYG